MTRSGERASRAVRLVVRADFHEAPAASAAKAALATGAHSGIEAISVTGCPFGRRDRTACARPPQKGVRLVRRATSRGPRTQPAMLRHPVADSNPRAEI